MVESPKENSVFKDTAYEVLKFVVYTLITVSVFALLIGSNEKELIKNFKITTGFFSTTTFLWFSSVILFLAGLLAVVKTIVVDENLDKPFEFCIKWLISIWGNFYYAFVIGLLSYFIYYLIFINLYSQNLIGTSNYISLIKSVWGIFIVGGAECIGIKFFLKRKKYPS